MAAVSSMPGDGPGHKKRKSVYPDKKLYVILNLPMKRSNKLLATLLTVFFLLSLLGPMQAFAARTFPDVSSDFWGARYISSAAERGYIQGYEDGTFRPNNQITRAEFCRMLNQALGLTQEEVVGFQDVHSNHWYYSEVKKAVAAGYIAGYEDNSFRGDNSISREEAAVVLSRITTPTDVQKNIWELVDTGSISSWALDAAKMLYSKGYMVGDDFKRFNPQGNLTRAELTKSVEVLLGAEKINGTDISLNAQNQTLSNTIYTGNVTINVGNNDEDVTFKNCQILGTLQIKGGDVIHLSGTGVNHLQVQNSSNQTKVLASGATTVKETTVSYGCTLEETNLPREGFTNVTLSGSSLKDNDVNLSGDFDLLTVSSPSRLNLLSGTIQKMVVNSEGKGSEIDLASKTTVNSLEVRGASDFTGKGTIKKADLKVSGSTFETPPQSYEGDVLVPGITPKHGATNVSVDSVIKLTFGETIYRTSGSSITSSYVEDSVVELRKGSSSGSTVSFDVSLSSNNSVITITPDSKLEKDTKYYVILKGGTVKNRDGLKNEAQTYYFNTGDGSTAFPQGSGQSYQRKSGVWRRKRQGAA